MAADIVAALRDERGRIVAYPTQLRIWSCGIHEGYWRLIFGDRPLPANMDELMDAWIDWELEYADDAAKTDGTLFVYIVNSYSQNKDAAVKFIECVSDLESEPYIYYAIHPDCNEPYERLNFQKWVESAAKEQQNAHDATGEPLTENSRKMNL